MFLRKLSAVLAAALTLAGSLALAQPAVENFEGFNASDPTLGTSTLPSTGGAPVYSTAFGPPYVFTGNTFPFSTIGGNTYLSWTERTDEDIRLTWPATHSIPGTGPVVQVAFGLRAQLDPTPANNQLDVLLARGTGATGTLFGLVVDANLDLRMANTNGFGTTRILQADAFDPTSGSNWGDGRWRVLVGRINLAGGGAGAVSWWVINPDTGVRTALPGATAVGLSNTRTGAIDQLGFGATFAAGGSSDLCQVDIDNLAFFPATNPLYDTEAKFLAAVDAYVPTAFNTDTDLDSVSNAIEDAAPNSGDGNSDGLDDAAQNNVTSLPNAVNGDYLTLSTAAPDAFFDVVTALNITTAGNDGATLPVGLVDFIVDGLTPGQTINVAIRYENALVPTPTNYYKHDVDPSSWWHYSGPGKATYNAATRTTTLTLTDGNPDADSDLTADGRILDPSGPGFGGVLAADVSSLTATAPFAGAPVTIAWTTTAELDNAGFTVKNAATGSIVGSFVPAEGSASSGASYSVVDADTLEAGEVRTYVLEDIDLAGKATTHGPVTASITGAASSVGTWTQY